MSKLAAIGLMAGLSLVPYHLEAARYDGSVPLLCAPVTVLECDAAGECQRGTPDSVNIPQFVRIDVAQKSISAHDDTGRTATIDNLTRVNGRTVMQGVQGSRGWSVVIAEETGQMSVAVVENRVGFVIFGACTPLEAAR